MKVLYPIIFISCMFCYPLYAQEGVIEHDIQADQLALNVLTSVADDVGDLIINSQGEKNPIVKKSKIINMIKKVTALIISLLKNRKNNHETKNYIAHFLEEENLQLSEQTMLQLEARIDQLVQATTPKS